MLIAESLQGQGSTRRARSALVCSGSSCSPHRSGVEAIAFIGQLQFGQTQCPPKSLLESVGPDLPCNRPLTADAPATPLGVLAVDGNDASWRVCGGVLGAQGANHLGYFAGQIHALKLRQSLFHASLPLLSGFQYRGICF